MKQTNPQLKIRLPPNLKSRLETAARASNRSMSAEIISCLQQWFGEQNAAFPERSEAAAAKLLRMTLDGDPLAARVAVLEAKIEKLEKRRGGK